MHRHNHQLRIEQLAPVGSLGANELVDRFNSAGQELALLVRMRFNSIAAYADGRYFLGQAGSTLSACTRKELERCVTQREETIARAIAARNEVARESAERAYWAERDVDTGQAAAVACYF